MGLYARNFPDVTSVSSVVHANFPIPISIIHKKSKNTDKCYDFSAHLYYAVSNTTDLIRKAYLMNIQFNLMSDLLFGRIPFQPYDPPNHVAAVAEKNFRLAATAAKG